MGMIIFCRSVFVLVWLFALPYALNASDVLEFTDADFDSKIKNHDIALIEFYAPWCGHCQRLAPEYERAATSLKSQSIPLVKVDCTANTAVCSRFGVSGYPTLKIFKGGEFSSEYQGPRDADGIVKYMRSKAGPSSRKLESHDDFLKLLEGTEPFVMGFFASESTDLFKAFKQAADLLNEDFSFVHSIASDLNSKLGFSDDVTVVFPTKLRNKFEDPIRKYSGGAVSSEIKDWVEKNIYGLAGHRTSANQKYFQHPLIVAFFDVDYERNPKGTNYWRNRVMKVAKKHREAGANLNFAVSSSKQMAPEMAEFGVDSPDDKKVYVIARDAKGRKFKMDEDFSMDTLDKFLSDVLADKLEPYLKSEPVPASQDEPVKVVVAKNFDEIVNDPKKDVLIEFYAPWCGHCKSLAPKYDELATKLKDEKDIVIAKMDATANDVPQPYDVRGFPTIYFAPKNSKDSPKQYQGAREVSDFISYLSRESSDPLRGYDRSGKEIKSEL